MSRRSTRNNCTWTLLSILTFGLLMFDPVAMAAKRKRDIPEVPWEFLSDGSMTLQLHGDDKRLHGPRTVDQQVFTSLFHRMQEASIETYKVAVNEALASCDEKKNCNPTTMAWMRETDNLSMMDYLINRAKSNGYIPLEKLANLPIPNVEYIYEGSQWISFARTMGEDFDSFQVARLPLEKIKIICRHADEFKQLLSLKRQDVTARSLGALGGAHLKAVLRHSNANLLLSDASISLSDFSKVTDIDRLKYMFFSYKPIMALMNHPLLKITFHDIASCKQIYTLTSYSNYKSTIMLLTNQSSQISLKNLNDVEANLDLLLAYPEATLGLMSDANPRTLNDLSKMSYQQLKPLLFYKQEALKTMKDEDREIKVEINPTDAPTPAFGM